MAPVVLFAGASVVTNIYSHRSGNLYFFGVGIGEGDSALDVDMLSPGVASAVLLGSAALLAFVWRATGERKRENTPTI
jgi:hypothetical protein